MKSVIAKKRKAYGDSFKLFKYGIRYGREFFIWKSLWIIFKTVKTILVDIMLLKFILDAILKGKTFGETAAYLIVCVVICFAEMYIDDWVNVYVQPIAKNKIHASIHKMIFDKVSCVDLKKFDDSKFYNEYIWTLEKSSEQIMSCYENYMKLISSILSIVSIFTLLFTTGPVVLIFAIIPMIFVSFFGKRINKIDYECDKEINNVTRRKNYSRRVFYLKQFAEDIRATGIKNVMKNNFEDSANKEIDIQKKYAFKKLFLTLIKDGSYGFAQMLGLYLYIIYKAMIEKTYSIGTCAAVVNAVDRLTGYFYQFSFVTLSIQKNAIYAKSFFEFFNDVNVIEADEKAKIPAHKFEVLELNRVGFKYANSTDFVLKDINLTINSGDKIAVVGLNGAGKSTLVKLILRFYDPQQGKILYNHNDMKKYNVHELRSHFSTIFQDFQLYATKLSENVIMNVEEDESQVQRAYECLKNVNLAVERENLSNTITKEFDENGLEFSGGQKQKIAIARALFADSDFIIMDEASSALDPIAEREINELIVNSLSDKTLMIITHRLTTVKHVDKIIFMDNGRIAESGSHSELMKLGGKYFELYKTQAEQYDTSTLQ